jgi:hypothetical protein
MTISFHRTGCFWVRARAWSTRVYYMPFRFRYWDTSTPCSLV